MEPPSLMPMAALGVAFSLLALLLRFESCCLDESFLLVPLDQQLVWCQLREGFLAEHVLKMFITFFIIHLDIFIRSFSSQVA